MRNPTAEELEPIKTMVDSAARLLEDAKLLEAQIEHTVAKLRRACSAPSSAILQTEDGVWSRLTGRTDSGQPVYTPIEVQNG